MAKKTKTTKKSEGNMVGRPQRKRLTALEKAQQIVENLMPSLSEEDREKLLIWAADKFLDLELD